MEKKSIFEDKALMPRIIYGAVIAILCITAIVVGIIAAASKPEDETPDTPPVVEPDHTEEEPTPTEPEVKPNAFTAPLVGTVMTEHDLSAPVFQETLGHWRVHAGIDISCEDGAKVYAAESGKIKDVGNDPKLGYTVKLEHQGGIVTVYANLRSDSCPFKVGDSVKQGELIGLVGDTATTELAMEPHLHFELHKDGKKVNPLDYIIEESKKHSLGIGK